MASRSPGTAYQFSKGACNVVNLPVTIRNQDLHHSELTIVRRFDSGAEIVIATVAPGDFYAAIVWDGCELVIRANG